ncbi:MAG: nuclear transport factor 2 family protein [Gammaproteobacteria bacterium]
METLALAHRYARIVDDRAFDQFAAIMLPGTRISGPGYSMDGLPAILQGMQKLLEFDRTFHLVGNQLGEWQDAQLWVGETYCLASHVYPRDGVEWKLDMAIRYQDRIVRHEGGLRFASRELRLAWVQDLPLTLPGGGA